MEIVAAIPAVTTVKPAPDSIDTLGLNFDGWITMDDTSGNNDDVSKSCMTPLEMESKN
jgi:hypothetical protein